MGARGRGGGRAHKGGIRAGGGVGREGKRRLGTEPAGAFISDSKGLLGGWNCRGGEGGHVTGPKPRTAWRAHSWQRSTGLCHLHPCKGQLAHPRPGAVAAESPRELGVLPPFKARQVHGICADGKIFMLGRPTCLYSRVGEPCTLQAACLRMSHVVALAPQCGTIVAPVPLPISHPHHPQQGVPPCLTKPARCQNIT